MNNRKHDLQNRILQILSLGIHQMRDIVALCYPEVQYVSVSLRYYPDPQRNKDRKKYQAAYASVSRVLRRLETMGVLFREHFREHDDTSTGNKSGGRWRLIEMKLNVTDGSGVLTDPHAAPSTVTGTAE